MVNQNVLDIGSIRVMPDVLNYQDEFFLYDNISGGEEHDSFFFTGLKESFPLKTNLMIFQICCSGSAIYDIGSMRYILEASQTILINPYNVLEGFLPQEGFKAMTFVFSADRFLSEDDDGSFMMVHSHVIHPYVLEGSQNEMVIATTIYGFLCDVITGRAGNNPFKEDSVQGSLMLLSSLVAQKISMLEESIPDIGKWNKNGVMNRFLSELSAHCREERSVSYYASKVFISPKYFAQLILKESGRHAKDWIAEYVIREAKIMLRNGGLTVQEVNNSLNFRNASFSGNYFKKATGQSPKQFMSSLSTV